MPLLRRPSVWSSNRARVNPRREIKNVVIFGETGVGKSSLINLIAGEKISETSSSAVGCTLEYKRHLLKLGDQRFALWDTAGLDEGSQGSVPAEKAEAYLQQLLRDLAKASSVDLLVYCVRGTRVRSALLTNYHLFYSAICRKKVPIAIVITGLENQEDNMDIWWLKNAGQFSALKMHFDNYACVTTAEPFMENATLKERRSISKTAVINMITSTCRTEQWMPAERSWAETAFSDIRAMLSPRDTGVTRNGTRMANVIMCDISQPSPLVDPTPIKRAVSFRSPVSLSRSLKRPMNFRNPILVANEIPKAMLPFEEAIKCTPERLFRVYQVSRKPTLLMREMKKGSGMIVKRGADLLIFCVRKEGVDDVRSEWEHFNLTYGGDLSPQIVVVIGATDQRSAEEWWKDAVGDSVARPGDPSVAHWPLSDSLLGTEEAKDRLRDLINTSCIDCSIVDFAGDRQIFKSRRGALDKTLLSLRMKFLEVEEPTDRRDVLTKWGVWEHVPVGGEPPLTKSYTVSYAVADSRNKQ